MSTDPRIGDTHNRALCCQCGTMRLYSKNAGLRNHLSRAYSDAEIAEHQPKRPHLWVGVKAWERQLADFKCATCKRITRHALMRDTCPEHRDADESDSMTDHRRPAPFMRSVDAIADQKLREEIGRLEGFGVRFEWRHCGADTQPTTIEAEQALFDLTWTFTLNESVPAQVLFAAIENVWHSISDRTRCEKIRWKTNKSARRAAFTYLEPWISEYIESTTPELIPRAVAWAHTKGEFA